MKLELKKVSLEKTYNENDDVIMYSLDSDIMLDDVKIGYIQVSEMTKEDIIYINTIDINAEYRNKGFGTQILKNFSGAYICADNENAERLYKRIGEEIDYKHCPECLEGNFDEYGNMYQIWTV